MLVYWLVDYSLRLPGLARWFVSLLKVGETWAYKDGACRVWTRLVFLPVPGMEPWGVVPPGRPRRCCKRAWYIAVSMCWVCVVG